MKSNCDDVQLSHLGPDTEGTLYLWIVPNNAGPPPRWGTLRNLIPRAIEAHAAGGVSVVEIEVGDCRISFDQIERLADDPRFSNQDV
jgi:hypothetical protein